MWVPTEEKKQKDANEKHVGVAVLLSNGNWDVKAGMNREDLGQRFCSLCSKPISGVISCLCTADLFNAFMG